MVRKFFRYAFAFGLPGLLIGSFLNVVILRYPIMLYRNWKSECEGMADEMPDHPALKDLSQPYDLVTTSSCGTA